MIASVLNHFKIEKVLPCFAGNTQETSTRIRRRGGFAGRRGGATSKETRSRGKDCRTNQGGASYSWSSQEAGRARRASHLFETYTQDAAKVGTSLYYVSIIS